jgi:glycosyltransferase involved in cell wall biosynthesis
MDTPARTPSVAVLLSTYNGAAHLQAQLDSLAAQEGVQVEVTARDDGSTDASLELLARWSGRWPRLAALLCGPRLGPARSFLHLLAAAPDAADAYAFCDQDDVWLPDKLARATSALAEGGDAAPRLYCSRVLFTDESLTPLGPSPGGGDGRFAHLLFENIAFGNTVVMNAAARRLILSRPPQGGMIMHDWWCALAVSAFGQVVFDDRPGLLYRQHGTNAVGGAAGRLATLATALGRLLRRPGRVWPVWAQAREFQRLFAADLAADKRELLDRLVASRASVRRRLAYAAAGPVIRAHALDALAGRLLIAAGLY